MASRQVKLDPVFVGSLTNVVPWYRTPDGNLSTVVIPGHAFPDQKAPSTYSQAFDYAARAVALVRSTWGRRCQAFCKGTRSKRQAMCLSTLLSMQGDPSGGISFGPAWLEREYASRIA